MATIQNTEQHWRSRLDARRSEIAGIEQSLEEQALRELSPEQTGEISKVRLHAADLATDAHQTEILNVLTARQRQQIQEVEEATQRLEHGTYGVCLRCAQNIPDRRLELIPEARFCLPCEKFLEEKGDPEGQDQPQAQRAVLSPPGQ